MADHEIVTGRLFYRIVGRVPAIEEDFFSYEQLGKPLLDDSPDAHEAHSGISVFETARQARDFARYMIRKRRPLGTYIAEVRIPDDVIITGQRDEPPRGHYNLFCSSEQLLIWQTGNVFEVTASEGR